jgi:hypothetical protein
LRYRHPATNPADVGQSCVRIGFATEATKSPDQVDSANLST